MRSAQRWPSARVSTRAVQQTSQGVHLGRLSGRVSEWVSGRRLGVGLATAFQDGTALLWDVNPTSWLKRACAVAGRRLSQQEWRDFLPGRPYQPSCRTP
jgi:hypothetical protein